MTLREQVHLEALLAGERRRAAASLGNCALQDVETRHSQPEAVLYERDPCPMCGVRGDIGCAHRRPVRLDGVCQLDRYPPRRRAI